MPDAATLTFNSDRVGVLDLYSKSADGSNEAEVLVSTAGSNSSGSWSPDGQTLVYSDSGSATGQDTWTLPFGGDPIPFLMTPFDEGAPRLPVDGRWVAYVSDQTGEQRVYVQPFPEGGQVNLISTGGGTEPVWSRDSRELFYRNGTEMVAVEVTTDPTFRFGRPELLFDESYDLDPLGLSHPNYDVSRDGERFLMVRGSGSNTRPTVTVVLNWHQELLERVPIP